jgi:hypothetical protein
MRSSTILLLICLLSATCKAQERIGYESYLECISNYVTSEDNISSSFIYGVLPTTREESKKYYNLDAIDNGSMALRKIDMLMRAKCISGDIDCLENHLRLSRFVDGYFAEVYFDDLSHYIEKFPEFYKHKTQTVDKVEFSRFCKLYEEINQ